MKNVTDPLLVVKKKKIFSIQCTVFLAFLKKDTLVFRVQYS